MAIGNDSWHEAWRLRDCVHHRGWGMGEVFLATDTRLERQVALKVLPSEFALDDDRRRRLIY